MGLSTGFAVRTLRHTGRGSEYFGSCERCGKHMAEAVAHERHTVYVDADGDLYLGGGGGATYAHTACMLYEGALITDISTTPRKGNLRLFTRDALARELMAAGISEANAHAAIGDQIARATRSSTT